VRLSPPTSAGRPLRGPSAWQHSLAGLLLATLPASASAQAPVPGPTASAERTSRGEVSGPDSATPAELEAQARLIELLVELDQRAKSDNSQLGTRLLRDYSVQLEACDENTPPADRARILHGLGLCEMNLGNRRKAVDDLQQAYDLLQPLPEDQRPSWAEKVTYHLGLAWMVWGEGQNCIARHSSESCILPIRPGGVHQDQEGARQALHYWTEGLQRAEPNGNLYLAEKWLLNVAAMTLGEWPDGVPEALRIPESVFASDQEFPRFHDVAPELGLNVQSLAGGAGVEDYDGDGRLDVVCSSWDTAGQLRLFLAREDGGFVERTHEAGLDGITGGLNLTQADYDGDGDVDLFVLRGGWQQEPGEVYPNSLLRNRGGAHFVDVTLLAMGSEHRPTQTAAWSDYDLDGDLDVYVGNESSPSSRNNCQLFRNLGDGRFEDVAVAAGVGNLRYTKGVTWGDMDSDGDPDLYVSNYQAKNRLYENDGQGGFEDVASERGVDGPRDSFPAWFWDFDNDGALDLYVASYSESSDGYRLAPVVASALGLPVGLERNRLYRGDGQGHFSEVAGELGLDAYTVTMGANHGDVDNDGFDDIYLGTGYPFFDGLTPNLLFRNLAGRGFADVTTAAGVGHLQKGHGVVFADLDDDGDLDLYEELGGAYPGDAFGNALFENPGSTAHWIEVELVGKRSNRFGLGSRVRAQIGTGDSITQVYSWAGSSGSFGANPFVLHLGLGSAEHVGELEVWWPASRTTQVFRDLPADRRVRIVEGEDGIEVREKTPRPFRR